MRNIFKLVLVIVLIVVTTTIIGLFLKRRETCEKILGRLTTSPTNIDHELTADETMAMACAVDYDRDGLSNYDDNCPAVANQDQRDSDWDGAGNVCDHTFFFVTQNKPPIADAGFDQVVEVTDSGKATITLDGSASRDTDRDLDGNKIKEYHWFESKKEYTRMIAEGKRATVILPIGVHEVELLVSDEENATARDTVIVTVHSVTP